MDFKSGDLVQLRSGGPSMTVEAVSTNHVFCSWFDGSQKKGDIFQPGSLVLLPVQGDTPSPGAPEV